MHKKGMGFLYAIIIILLCAISVSAVTAVADIAQTSGTSTTASAGEVVVFDDQIQWDSAAVNQIQYFVDEYGSPIELEPGAEGAYSLTLKNTATFPVRYSISAEEECAYDLPLRFQVHDIQANAYSDWMSSVQFSGYSNSLASGAEQALEILWQWPFEIDYPSDLRDTAAGKAANSEDIVYALTLTVHAEQVDFPDPRDPDDPSKPSGPDDPDDPDDPDGPNKPSGPDDPDDPDDPDGPDGPDGPDDPDDPDDPKQPGGPDDPVGPSDPDISDTPERSGSPKTGDNALWWPYLVIAVCLVLLLLFLLWRRKKEGNDDE